MDWYLTGWQLPYFIIFIIMALILCVLCII